MKERLSEATLPLLPDWVRRPGPRPAPRVVHLGIGAFHRAHQAVVFDDLGWSVTGASLRSPAVREAMAPQDCLYSLVVGDEVRVIGAVREVLLDTPELAARIASYELAYRMQGCAPEAVDIAQETADTKQLYGLDNPITEAFGKQCLLARRLVGAQ